MPVPAVIERVRAEFIEMPGLQLTRNQVRRFCGIEESVVQDVLDSLVAAGFLQINTRGCYMRTGGVPTVIAA